MAPPKINQWDGQRVTVMGLGLHGGGLAVATWMLRHGACVTVTDLKTSRELKSSVVALERIARERRSGSLTLILGRHRAQDFRDADFVIQNPGVPRESKFLTIAHAANVPIENEASLFFRAIRALPAPPRIIAVTGTRGKSTTAALIHAMLRQSGRTAFLAGNIRIPMFSILDDILRVAVRGPVDVVLELSSWHCELLSRATGGPDVAVLTNLLPDHLNRYASMRSYAAAKARLARFQDRRGVVVANADQAVVRVMAALSLGRVVWFASRAPRRRWRGFTLRDRDCVRFQNGRSSVVTPRSLLALPGAHNTMNLLAAIATAIACGVPALDIRRALRSFRGLTGRLERVACRRGVTYVNDTCATTPDATIAALRAVSGRVVLIAGGSDKNLSFDAWAEIVARTVKAIVFLPGTATEKMKRALQQLEIRNSTLEIREAKDMRSAVRAAKEIARRQGSGSIVLLSPGAASFGLFTHEFDRGGQFNREVKRYK